MQHRWAFFHCDFGAFYNWTLENLMKFRGFFFRSSLIWICIWIFRPFAQKYIAQPWCIIAMCARSHNQLSLFKQNAILFFIVRPFVCLDSKQAYGLTDWLSEWLAGRREFVAFVCLFKQISIYHCKCKIHVTMHIEFSNENKETNTPKNAAAAATAEIAAVESKKCV